MDAINDIELLLCGTLRFVAVLQLALSIAFDSLDRNGSLLVLYVDEIGCLN